MHSQSRVSARTKLFMKKMERNDSSIIAAQLTAIHVWNNHTPSGARCGKIWQYVRVDVRGRVSLRAPACMCICAVGWLSVRGRVSFCARVCVHVCMCL